MSAETEFTPPPFEARQYLLTVILVALGVWCVRDGWFNPAIENRLFNQILGPILLAWATWDGLRMRRREVAAARRRWEQGEHRAPEPGASA